MARRSRKNSGLLTYNPGKFWIVFIAACAAAVIFLILSTNRQGVSNPVSNSGVEGASTNSFDQYGYNDTARLFNGTGSSWCLAKSLPANCLGIYSPDKLVMKWNAEWDRGNAEGWSTPPYKAWTDNEWNGKNGGSGSNWHYKIVWVPPCGADYTLLANGGYCIWGQFEVIMDQGVDPNLGPGHMWFGRATPAGYGAYGKP